MNPERFRFFQASHLESDLLIGVGNSQFRNELLEVSRQELGRLRNLLDQFIGKYPRFKTSLAPLPLHEFTSESGSLHVQPGTQTIPPEVKEMIACGEATGTGPMSSVAGLFAEQVGKTLSEQFQLDEVVVENGGDLHVRINSQLVSVIHAGRSPLSDKVAFMIPPGVWGVCTSSGTLGHSYSQGRADAVTVIARSTPLADAWATSLANKVQHAEDIENVLEKVAGISDIQGCAILVGERIGIRGEIEVKLLS